MRALIALILVLFSYSSSNAAIYVIDLNDLGPAGSYPPPCYCDSGPVGAPNNSGFISHIYTFAQSGTVDFGQVNIFPIEAFSKVPPEPGHPTDPFFIRSIVTVVHDGSYPEPNSVPSVDGVNPLVTPLLFGVSAGDKIRIAWFGPYIYQAPLPASAVPEASTWAMSIIGFNLLAFLMHRRSRHLNNVRLTYQRRVGPAFGGYDA